MTEPRPLAVEPEKESQRILDLLQGIQRMLGISNRDVERSLGLSPSYLSRLYKGLIALRFEHIVKLVQAMGFRLDEFFSVAYPAGKAPPSPAAARVRALFALADPSEPRLRTETVEAVVRDTLEKVLRSEG